MVMPDNRGTSTGALRHLTPDQMQGLLTVCDYRTHYGHDHIKALSGSARLHRSKGHSKIVRLTCQRNESV